MRNAEIEKEIEKLEKDALSQIEAVFKKYNALPSQGLDKNGEYEELHKIMEDVNSKILAMKKNID